MSLAAETRAAVRARPWLLRALRAGVVNYAAAAESLDVEGETESIATALRRFAEDLPPAGTESREVTVRMRSGVGLAGVDVGEVGDGGAGSPDAAGEADGPDAAGEADGPDAAGEADGPDDAGAEALLTVGDSAIVTADGSLTAIVVDGAVDSRAQSAVVDRLAAENVVVDAAGVADGDLVVVVPRNDGANALRLVESALSAVPTQ
ncbi:DUF7523 family protein [Halobellus ordinarius]|uniref:DUF7523 family protein n=1 Tax=Halobellus ordinarius TaxID=3075120 RepID=UPI0028804DA4|nr:hypothetical protein [Halobellus sp. ZY16]